MFQPWTDLFFMANNSGNRFRKWAHLLFMNHHSTVSFKIINIALCSKMNFMVNRCFNLVIIYFLAISSHGMPMCLVRRKLACYKWSYNHNSRLHKCFEWCRSDAVRQCWIWPQTSDWRPRPPESQCNDSNYHTAVIYSHVLSFQCDVNTGMDKMAYLICLQYMHNKHGIDAS